MGERVAPSPVDHSNGVDWLTLCRQLERRAGRLVDPVETARHYFQSAEILRRELGREEQALEAYRAASEVCPSYIPAFLALRELAIERDDEALAVHLFEVAINDLPGSDACAPDLAEIYQTFLLLWCFRWRNADRAGQALTALDACEPWSLGYRIEHLFDSRDGRIDRLTAWLDTAADAHRGAIATTLGRLILDKGGSLDLGRRVLTLAADRDLLARWRLIEDAARFTRADSLVFHLEAAAVHASRAIAAALRFVAGEISEYRLADQSRAEALYRASRRGRLQAVVGIKRVIAEAWGSGEERERTLACLLAREADGLGQLEGVFSLRAGELFLEVGDHQLAEEAIKRAIEREADQRQSLAALERMYWERRRWPDFADALRAARRSDRDQRILLAAVCEHAMGDAKAAIDALTESQPAHRDARANRAREIPPDDLLALRTLQRVFEHHNQKALIRLYRDEANTHEHAERRCDLYLKLGRLALRQSRDPSLALASLYWVLDCDPKNLTALRLIEHVSRLQGDEPALVKVLLRQLPLLKGSDERFRILREVGRYCEVTQKDPGKAAQMYADALAENPDDEATAVDLQRLYTSLERFDALRTLLAGRLRRTLSPARRATLLMQLAEIHEMAHGDRAAARQLYDEALRLVQVAGADVPPELRDRASKAMGRFTELQIASPVSGESASRPSRPGEMGLPADTSRLASSQATILFTENSSPFGGQQTLVEIASIGPQSNRAPDAPAGGGPPEAELSSASQTIETVSGPGEAGGLDASSPPVDWPQEDSDPTLTGSPEIDGERRDTPQVMSASRTLYDPFPPPGPSVPNGGPSPSAARAPFGLPAGPVQRREPIREATEVDGPAISYAAPAFSVPADGTSPADTMKDGPTLVGAPPDREVAGPAMLARMRRGRLPAMPETWPDFGDREAAWASDALACAVDAESRIRAGYLLARRYELLDERVAAIGVYRYVLRCRASEIKALHRLRLLYSDAADWRGMAEIIKQVAGVIGHRERKRALLLEVARLERGPLNNPEGAIPLYREALDFGAVDPALLEEMAETLTAARGRPPTSSNES